MFHFTEGEKHVIQVQTFSTGKCIRR